jgi:predicted cobalt transporter CbtA
MFAVAAYSAKPWMPDAGFDATEDLLHSVAATVMGFAFAFGVAAVAIQLRTTGTGWRLLDGLAVAASVVLPLGMSTFGEADGVLQRMMFGIAYVWYGRELVSNRSSGAGAVPAEQ